MGRIHHRWYVCLFFPLSACLLHQDSVLTHAQLGGNDFIRTAPPGRDMYDGHEHGATVSLLTASSAGAKSRPQIPPGASKFSPTHLMDDEGGTKEAWASHQTEVECNLLPLPNLLAQSVLFFFAIHLLQGHNGGISRRP